MTNNFNHNPRVSIIIPVFKDSPYIIKTLESVINQTYQDFEVVITCEPSNDGTFRLVEDYIKKFKCISLYQNTQILGPGKNWNKGVSLAKWSYIKSYIKMIFYSRII